MNNPLDVSRACAQGLGRTAASLGDTGDVDSSKTLALLLSTTAHLSSLVAQSPPASGLCLAPLGSWCGSHQSEALNFFNTASLHPQAARPDGGAPTGPAPAASLPPQARVHVTPTEGAQFDAALEASVRVFSQSATALLQQQQRK